MGLNTQSPFVLIVFYRLKTTQIIFIAIRKSKSKNFYV